MITVFLLIDKPKGISSHDVIYRLRKITGEKKIGHAGTLDPNATGLLLVGVGRESTKKLWTKFGKLDKTYSAEITLGEERETDDVKGEIRDPEFVTRINLIPRKPLIEEALKTFVGEQLQIPPAFSAIKIKGKKAYELARKGPSLCPSLSPRKVTIYSIKLLEYKFPTLVIETKVSSGTYVRALARDLGRKLKCGAYLNNLRRVKIGKYKVENSVCLDKLTSKNISKYYFD
jgi:tRNA pseudouridine55 synthase